MCICMLISSMFTQLILYGYSLCEISYPGNMSSKPGRFNLRFSFFLENHDIGPLPTLIIPGDPYQLKSPIDDIRDLFFDG